jgi:hypothetical protein
MPKSNAGRKPQYGEATTTVAFRVPISQAPEIKKLVAAALQKVKGSLSLHPKPVCHAIETRLQPEIDKFKYQD